MIEFRTGRRADHVRPVSYGRFAYLEKEDRRAMTNARPRLTTQLDPHRDPSVRLLEAWRPVLDTLAALVDEPTFNLWICSLHPHRRQAGCWVLATRPQCVQWVTDRFGRLLAEAAGCPVTIVACEVTRL